MTQQEDFFQDLDKKINEITKGEYKMSIKLFEFLLELDSHGTRQDFNLYQLFINDMIPPKLYSVIHDYIFDTGWDYITPDGYLIEPSTNPVRGYIYIIKLENGLYKIGKTKHISKRMDVFSVSFPMKWELFYSFLSNDYTMAEKTLHKYYSDKREIGEWFKLNERDINSILMIKDFDL